VRLTIRTALWRAHVARVAADTPGLIPVVKGNGYGFGREWLATAAAEFADTVAVGTVHELGVVPESIDAVVLTPTLVAPPSERAVLTVGNDEHIEALAGWSGRVVVKIASSMQRYGRTPELVGIAIANGLDVIAVSIHPPLAGSPSDHATEIARLVTHVDPSLPVWVSHLDPAAYASLPTSHHYRIRLGTLLWHGDKSMLALTADVLDVRPVRAGAVAGYRLGSIECDGHLVMIGAGTAHGVAPLGEGLSPFHFARNRMPLHEPPHMHTSMCFVAGGAPLPSIGERVDVQRPLHCTHVDEFEWL
jgi:alanine racemase